SVGRGGAWVPIDFLDDPVNVFLELPGQTEFADPGIADDRDQTCPPLLAGDGEKLLQHPQLVLASDEWGLDAVRAATTATGRFHPQRPPAPPRLFFAFQSERSQVLVGDGIVGQVLRRVADDDGARFGDRLEAGGGVDYVTQDQPLIVSSRPDCRLAGVHADTQPEVGDADLLTE